MDGVGTAGGAVSGVDCIGGGGVGRCERGSILSGHGLFLIYPIITKEVCG